MKRALRLISSSINVYVAIWPLLVLLSIRVEAMQWLLWCTLELLTIKLFCLSKHLTENTFPILLSLVGLVTVGLALVCENTFISLWYPVLINSCLFCFFGSSLFRRKTVIQLIAEKMEGTELSPEGISYTRKVTYVWCLFFIVNGFIATLTCLIGNLTIWALYNGFISYGLIGLLLGAEYLYRRKVLNAPTPESNRMD